MKRRLISLFAVIIIAAAAFALPACEQLDFLFGTDGIRQHEHEYTTQTFKVSCTEDGYVLHTCKICKQSYKDEIVYATGHKVVEVEERASTCVTEGYTQGYKCSVCGEILSGCEAIPTVGHTVIEVEEVEATFVKPGHTAGAKCAVCGEIFSGCEEIPVKTPEDTLLYTPRSGNSSYGYYDLENGENAKEAKSLYYNMYAVCEEFTLNTADVLPTEERASETETVTFYLIGEIDLSEYTLGYEEVVAVWRTFEIENPAYYWFGDMFVKSSGEKMISLLLTAEEDYAKYSVRRECDERIEDMQSECANALSGGMTDGQKAAAIHDYLLNKVEYAYKKDGSPETAAWAHDITGAARYGKGVCETYAKAYLYLCLRNGVDCIIVTGTAGTTREAHAWNYIKADGEWYGVDATWNDGRTNFREYFGASDYVMSREHFPTAPDDENKIMQRYYELPELSDTSLNLG